MGEKEGKAFQRGLCAHPWAGACFQVSARSPRGAWSRVPALQEPSGGLQGCGVSTPDPLLSLRSLLEILALR